MPTEQLRSSRAFGAAVKAARTQQGLTQAEVAQRAGVGRPWLSELESGKRTAELGRALSVVDALGLAVSLTPVVQSGPDLGALLTGSTANDSTDTDTDTDTDDV